MSPDPSPSPASPVSMELPEEIALAIEDFSSADRAEARASALAPEGEFAHLVKEADARYSALTAAILSRLREAETGREEAEAKLARISYVWEQPTNDLHELIEKGLRVEAADAARDAALARVERLEKALAFYRDEWEADCDAVLIGPGIWYGGSVSHDPTEALRKDHGNRAAAALSEAPSQGDQ